MRDPPALRLRQQVLGTFTAVCCVSLSRTRPHSMLALSSDRDYLTFLHGHHCAAPAAAPSSQTGPLQKIAGPPTWRGDKPLPADHRGSTASTDKSVMASRTPTDHAVRDAAGPSRLDGGRSAWLFWPMTWHALAKYSPFRPERIRCVAGASDGSQPLRPIRFRAKPRPRLAAQGLHLPRSYCPF
jgi:hypothetical protein